MEPGIREFFGRLSLSIGLCIIWMAINMTIGIKYGYAFFENNIHLSNIIFYIWAVVSFAALIFIYMRIWKKPIENLND
jgi:hypothetical protein